MTDCANAMMRDLLPDHAAGALDAATETEVQAHLAACDDCRAEVALLRVARSVRPASMPVDVARIVAAVQAASFAERAADAPAPAVSTSPVAAGPRLVPPSIEAPARRPAARRGRSTMVWRMAASVALVAAGGWSAWRFQDGAGASVATVVASSRSDSAVPRSDTALPETTALAAAGSVSTREPAVAPRSSAISVGDLSDFSDDELQEMLDRLERWDGATSADPVTALPVLTVEQRGETR